MRHPAHDVSNQVLSNIPPGFWYSLILLSGILMVAFGIMQAADYAETSNWRTTSGTIIDAQVETITRTRRDDAGRAYTVYEYKPLIQYAYRVDGQPFTHDRVRLSESMCIGSFCVSDLRAETNNSSALERVNAYPLHSNVTVYYDPANPQEAVLVRNVSFFVYFSLGMGFLMVLLGVGLFWSAMD